MEPERILATAIGSCLFSGVIPVLSMELIVGAAAVALPATYGIPLVLGCATAQMVAKTGLYACARWLPSRLPRRAAATLARAEERLARVRNRAWILVLTSACLGVPPFYLVTLGCGAIGIGLLSFVSTGFVGHLIRLGAIVWTAEAASGAISSLSP